MNTLMPFAATAAMLGSALVAGIFFAFSSFVMKALSRVPAAEGIAAMQSINIVVINPSFLGLFMGTAALSAGLAGFALPGWPGPAAKFFLGGAVCYLAGTFAVTMFGNVPLNDRLATAAATDPGSAALWAVYLERWTRWNHVRTAAATAAATLYAIGLMQI